jgi:hypothetical protein
MGGAIPTTFAQAEAERIGASLGKVGQTWGAPPCPGRPYPHHDVWTKVDGMTNVGRVVVWGGPVGAMA